jgi:hypothetical protein
MGLIVPKTGEIHMRALKLLVVSSTFLLSSSFACLADGWSGVSMDNPPIARPVPFAISEGDNPLPTVIGQCTQTNVRRIENRLQNSTTGKFTAGSGSAIEYTNGGYQVSYNQVEAIDKSLPGDRVRMCLTVIPTGCPPGDARGRVYKTTNMRTGKTWEEADSEHSCGGA